MQKRFKATKRRLDDSWWWKIGKINYGACANEVTRFFFVGKLKEAEFRVSDTRPTDQLYHVFRRQHVDTWRLTELEPQPFLLSNMTDGPALVAATSRMLTRAFPNTKKLYISMWGAD